MKKNSLIEAALMNPVIILFVFVIEAIPSI